MLFDQVGELPVATVRRTTRSPIELVAHELASWISARWRWFKPRAIPVTVAFVGMLGVIHAVNYLSRPPAEHTTRAGLAIDAGAPGAMMFVDGTPYRDGAPVAGLEGTHYRVRLVLQR